jgi:hypothetical protein
MTEQLKARVNIERTIQRKIKYPDLYSLNYYDLILLDHVLIQVELISKS